MPLQITGRVTEEQVAMVMKTLDADNDGSVTFTEFSNALELVECVPPPLCLSLSLSCSCTYTHSHSNARARTHTRTHTRTQAHTHTFVDTHRHTGTRAQTLVGSSIARS